jgi:hypothetical protein
MIRWLSMLVIVLPVALVSGARAQSATAVTYTTGWNMAGGPAGADLSPAAAVVAYVGGAYQDVQPRQTQTCQGYWAYFRAPATVTLPATATALQTCPLQSGWTLVGNPFDAAALLPSGVTGWYWNTGSGSYQLVTSIPAGGAVWLYAAGPGAVTLTNSAAIPPAATPVLINATGGAGPYTVHVGDNVEVIMPVAYPSRASESGAALRFQSAGVTGELTCVGDPGCQFQYNNQFWLYRAVSAGVATVTVTPDCVGTTSPCASPVETVAIDVIP